ncbi:MAG: Zn-ribbon containing protein [Candidatus Pacearchaeota archaeon]
MPHQCIHCSKIIPVGSKELLEGCSNCGSKFFFYIKDEQVKKIEQENSSTPITELNISEKKKIESDVRSILKVEDETQPVILDLESIRVIKPGKYEIDLVSLINRKPIVFKIDEGKYLIDF